MVSVCEGATEAGSPCVQEVGVAPDSLVMCVSLVRSRLGRWSEPVSIEMR